MVGGAVAPLHIEHASADPNWRDHPALHVYGVESYLAVPLHRRDGTYFGTLCAFDTLPCAVPDDALAVFHLLAQLIAFELEADERTQQREAEVRGLEDFIAMAGHDLRQPLSVLYGRGQLLARQLARGADSATLASGIEALLVQSRRAVHLSDLLLDVARLESGQFVLDSRPCDLVAVAREAVDDVQAAAPEHTLTLVGPPSLPLSADAPRLGQVLRNLLENAVKYSPDHRGPITITVVPPGPPHPASAHVIIRDSGIGVAVEELPHLFERRFRAPNAVAREIPGTGLGLHISRQIVEAHGGRVWAEVPPDGGLAVTIALPAA